VESIGGDARPFLLLSVYHSTVVVCVDPEQCMVWCLMRKHHSFIHSVIDVGPCLPELCRVNVDDPLHSCGGPSGNGP
jgi:hypothetical protein